MTVSIVSPLMLWQISSPEHVVKNTNNMIGESLVYLKKISDVRRGYVYVVRHTAATTSSLKTLNLATKVSTHVLERSGDGPLEKYRRVLNEKVSVTSNNRIVRTNNQYVATYEQVGKSLSYLCPKQGVETDGILTQLPNL